MSGRRIAVAVLAAAAVHEFAWQLAPAELQGDVRAVTQWPLIGLLCLALAARSRSGFVAAVAACVAVMSSTTAICSATWLAHPWPATLGEDQCSARWGVPMVLVSALCAAIALMRWRR